MGTIYKIKPEIISLIVERKKREPNLSCRQLSILVKENFNLRLSKSSINQLVKEAGLSMPVGRRLRKKKPRIQMPPLPELELKTETPAKPPEPAPAAPPEPPVTPPTIPPPPAPPVTPPAAPVEKTPEAPTVPVEKPSEIPAPAIETPIPASRPEAILLQAAEYLIGTSDQMQAKSVDLSRLIINSLQEVRGLKVNLSSGETLYLDGRLYTIWSTPHIPFDFSATLHEVKKRIKKYSSEDGQFILFMAPGYATPTNEFFNFILGLEAKEKRLTRFTLYGNKFEDLEAIPFPLGQAKKQAVIFALWPWQFNEYRKVKKLGEFRPFHFAPLKKDLFVADIEIDLLLPATNRPVAFRGSALKTNLSEKVRLVILSNATGEIKTDDLINIYLNRWPNLEEAFQDFSRKVELFTYTAASQHFFSIEGLNLAVAQDVAQLSETYLKALDLYVRWHFLPAGYENQDFSIAKERFYNLKVDLKKEDGYTLAIFAVPQGYAFLKDLEYACRRLNEREIESEDGSRLWFSIGS